MFLHYSWSGSQRAPPPVGHLGVSHCQHEATLPSVEFLTKLHFHEEDGGDFENNHLFHTCGPLGNLSPYDQRLSKQVIKLLAKPHPVIETLAERTWKLRTIWLFPYCSSMKISHPALFLVTRYSRYSRRSNVLDRFRLNFVRHFRCFYSESDFVFQPVSESYD